MVRALHRRAVDGHTLMVPSWEAESTWAPSGVKAHAYTWHRSMRAPGMEACVHLAWKHACTWHGSLPHPDYKHDMEACLTHTTNMTWKLASPRAIHIHGERDAPQGCWGQGHGELDAPQGCRGQGRAPKASTATPARHLECALRPILMIGAALRLILMIGAALRPILMIGAALRPILAYYDRCMIMTPTRPNPNPDPNPNPNPNPMIDRNP